MKRIVWKHTFLGSESTTTSVKRNRKGTRLSFRERKFYEREKQIIEIVSRGAFFGACLYASVSDGADSHDCLHALSHASARVALRLHLRMAVGADRGVCCAAFT